MPRFRCVVSDEDKAARHDLRAQGITDELLKAHPELEKGVRKRPKGAAHGEADSDCPGGLPNCRNCGDPAFADKCKAAGHCPACGVAGSGGHGIAPDSVLAANGYTLELVD